ncbi:MAG TPA: LPS export ABC transporter periplasmic protein LptC [Burkholderiales bacterium]
MKIRAANALPLGLMFLLGAMTFLLQYAVQRGGPGDARPARHEPDAVIENFRVDSLGKDGKPEATFSAPKMFHFPDDDSAEVLYPRMVKLADDGGHLVATANRGVLTKDGEEGFLYGNVVLVREGTPGRESLRAETEFLHIVNDQHVLQTDRPVVITEGNSIVSGVGMEMHQDTRELKLFSQVRGTIDAKK